MFCSIAIGFPIPYFGILTNKGSLFKVMSPLLDLKYNDNITEDFKLPPPTRVAVNSGLASEMFPYNINIVPYVDKETFVGLKGVVPSVKTHPHTFAWYTIVSRFSWA